MVQGCLLVLLISQDKMYSNGSMSWSNVTDSEMFAESQERKREEELP